MSGRRGTRPRADIRDLVRGAFEASVGSRDYREVHARLRRSDLAASEKRIDVH